MPAFKYPRTSQPQGAVEIDWSNPITLGLIFAVNGAEPSYDAAINKPLTQSGSLLTDTGIKGKGTTYAANTYQSSLYKGAVTSTRDISLFTIITKPVSSPQWAKILSLATPAGGAVRAGIGTTDDNRIYLGVGAQSSYENDVREISASTVGSTDAYLTNFKSGAGYFYKNGALQGSTSMGSYSDGRQGYIVLGVDFVDATNRYWPGAIHLSYAWNRALRNDEIKSLSDNPWQLFKPVNRSLWIPGTVSGGGAATGTGDLSPLSLTSPTATASGTVVVNGTGSGGVAAVTLTALTGTASGTSTGNGLGSGSFAGLSLSFPAGAAASTRNETGSGVFAALSLISPSATASSGEALPLNRGGSGGGGGRARTARSRELNDLLTKALEKPPELAVQLLLPAAPSPEAIASVISALKTRKTETKKASLKQVQVLLAKLQKLQQEADEEAAVMSLLFD